MDLKKLWDEIEEQDLSPGGEVQEAGADEIRTASLHPLQKLRKRLWQKLLWGIGINLAYVLGFIAILLSAGSLEVGWSRGWILVVMFASSILPVFPIWRLYRRLPGLVQMDNKVLELLKTYRDTVRSVFRIEDIYAWIMAVPAPAIGAWYGMLSALEPGETMEGWDVLVALVVGIVLSPLTIWLTKKLNKIAFGKQLKEVEDLIEGMEEV